VFGKKSGLAAMLFLPILMAIQISRHTKTGIKRVTFVDSLTPVFGFGIQTHIGLKNRIKNTLRRNGKSSSNVDGRGIFGCLISLPILLLCAIIAIAIIAEQFG